MLNPIQILLERLAERCIALAAGMLATTIESLEIAQRTEQHQRLQDLASQNEAAGQNELATLVRERAQSLLTGSPAARGETLLRDVVPLRAPLSVLEHADLLPGSGTPVPDKSSSHRANGRAKRARTATPASLSPSQDSSDSDLFFPMNPEQPAVEPKGATE